MFLTLEDPRARIQGSRDPLGVQPVWAVFGRHVVSNLTTVSTSVRGFTTQLLARYYIQELIDADRAGEQNALSNFLRMEQICGYARHIVHGVESGILGIERIKRFVAELGAYVAIQDDPSGFILSDQKTYGLWGLYTVAARASGLLEEGMSRLTPYAFEFVSSQYVPRLRRVDHQIKKLVLDGGKLATRKSDPLLKTMGSILSPTFSQPERRFYGHTLRDAQTLSDPDSSSRQAIVAELLTRHTDLEEPVGRGDVLKLAETAQTRDEGLSRRLRRVATLEAFLAPAEALFEYLQARHNQRPEDLASNLRDHWGSCVPNLDPEAFAELGPEIESVTNAEMRTVMGRCHIALARGDYKDAVLSALEWNRLVMRARQAVPWIREVEGRLDVRYRSVERVLPTGDELGELWRNSYFIDALKSVTRQLREDG